MLPERRKMYDLFDRFFEDFDNPFFYPDILRKIQMDIRMPMLDIENRKDSIVVSAELPGVRKEDIKMEIDNNAITIKAETEHEEKDEKKDYYYSERSKSSYQRTIKFPEEVDPDQATAEYKNGVLIVTVKKQMPGKGKKELKIK